MSGVFGERPRPWILADNVDPNTDVGEALLHVSPTVTFLQRDPLPEEQVRQIDYDAYVSVGGNRHPENHLFVIQFGGDGIVDTWRTMLSGGGRASVHVASIYVDTTGRAGRLTGPDDGVCQSVTDLARRSLVPHLLDVSPRDLLKSSQKRQFKPDRSIAALIREQNGAPCAGYWTRGEELGPQWWWLPENTPHRDQWIFAAFAAWRELDSERFPSPPDWTRLPGWMGMGELAAYKELNEHRAETARLLGERFETERKLEHAVDHERARADQRERLLLTAQGDILKDQVQETLADLGFTVMDSDSLEANQAEKLEDLRVSDGNWTGLVEVKGYTKGAKTNDLQKFHRPTARYIKDTGKAPDALWYVVNQHAGSDPAQRRPPLSSNPDDVESFSQNGGLVIDTAGLFRLQRAVEDGAVSASDARALLVETTGIFQYRPKTGEA